MNTIPSVRLATAADEEAWLSLALELWPESTPAQLSKEFQRVLLSGKETILLYENGSQPSGMVMVSLRNDYVEGTDSTPVGYIEGIFVRKEHRGQQTARRLVEAAEQWARQQGCSEMASDAELPNTVSQSFHQAVGFEEVNRIVCYRKTIE